MKIEDWQIEIAFHFPHDRFILGQEYIRANKEFKYNTIKIHTENCYIKTQPTNEERKI